MGAAKWAIPVGVLAALCAAMFAFTCWWWPRHYRKGVIMDMRRVDEEGGPQGDRSVQREANRAVIQAAIEGRSALQVLEERGIATDGTGPLRMVNPARGTHLTEPTQAAYSESGAKDAPPAYSEPVAAS